MYQHSYVYYVLLIQLPVILCIITTIDATRNNLDVEIMNMPENDPSKIKTFTISLSGWCSLMQTNRRAKTIMTMCFNRQQFPVLVLVLHLYLYQYQY